LVDDNLVGTRSDHMARAKDLFRAMAAANLGKQWIGQVTINFADDEELLTLAARSGCKGVFIGFETPSAEGLCELGKKFNLVRGRDFRASVARIHRHGMVVVGSFIIGLDADQPGIGGRIAETATRYGVDNINALFLTPLPGTQLWDKMAGEKRLAVNDFPQDWQYYTLTYPVAHYLHLSLDQVIAEMDSCGRKFYSIPRILRRAGISLWQRRGFLISLVASLSYRSNLRVDRHAYAEFKRARGSRYESSPADSRRRLTTPVPVDNKASAGLLAQDILGPVGEEIRPQGEPT
jgi:radical SAM superfamily enzyme YgiQ (UPF0313 family)